MHGCSQQWRATTYWALQVSKSQHSPSVQLAINTQQSVASKAQHRDASLPNPLLAWET